MKSARGAPEHEAPPDPHGDGFTEREDAPADALPEPDTLTAELRPGCPRTWSSTSHSST